MLGLSMKRYGSQLRSACPACKAGGDRALTINADRGVYFCFSDKAGGDTIAFCAHIRGSSPKEAAQHISKHFGLETVTNRSPPQQAPEASGEDPDWAANLDLDPIHEAVEALGISPVVADKIGAGFCSKGTMAKRVLIPLRLKSGVLIGFMGVGSGMEPEYMFPKNLEQRAEGQIIKFQKKA
jgi:DNA primase